VALVADPDRERVLLLRHEGHQYGWEPPGGRGEADESPAATAYRETVEETGLRPEITDLLLVEYLQFDYGEGPTAPVLQAVFAGRATGEPTVPAREAAIPTAQWFHRADVPADAQFRGLILGDLLG
jgi:ADP-ribose pyrophosphatase YjhB (NUDIX family)